MIYFSRFKEGHHQNQNVKLMCYLRGTSVQSSPLALHNITSQILNEEWFGHYKEYNEYNLPIKNDGFVLLESSL